MEIVLYPILHLPAVMSLLNPLSPGAVQLKYIVSTTLPTNAERLVIAEGGSLCAHVVAPFDISDQLSASSDVQILK